MKVSLPAVTKKIHFSSLFVVNLLQSLCSGRERMTAVRTDAHYRRRVDWTGKHPLQTSTAEECLWARAEPKLVSAFWLMALSCCVLSADHVPALVSSPGVNLNERSTLLYMHTCHLILPHFILHFHLFVSRFSTDVFLNEICVFWHL